MNAEYFRATVMDIVDESQMNSEVKVKLVDEGFVKIVSVSYIQYFLVIFIFNLNIFHILYLEMENI